MVHLLTGGGVGGAGNVSMAQWQHPNCIAERVACRSGGLMAVGWWPGGGRCVQEETFLVVQLTSVTVQFAQSCGRIGTCTRPLCGPGFESRMLPHLFLTFISFARRRTGIL